MITIKLDQLRVKHKNKKLIGDVYFQSNPNSSSHFDSMK